MINMDSQIPNKVVEEWIKQGNLFPDATMIRPKRRTGNPDLTFMWKREIEKSL